jgi:hypothetical protein
MISTVASNISAIAVSCTLPPEQIEKRVSYAEIRSLVQSVTVLAECLMPLDPNGVAVRLDEIGDWSDHAKLVWDAAFQPFGKRSD